MKPRLLDLFCGAGGAAMGYHRAGFEVYGIDNKPQKNYPFPFLQMDALEAMDRLLKGEGLTFSNGETLYLADFDAYHASPPCQGYGRLQINTRAAPKLIEPVRDLFISTGRPYVIENVVGAPLIDPVILCGSMFGLGVWRHRLFEGTFKTGRPCCRHTLVPYPMDVTGTGGPCLVRFTGGGGIHRKPKTMAEAKTVMGIDWMIRREIVEAIPPAYTEYIGKYLMQAIKSEVTL